MYKNWFDSGTNYLAQTFLLAGVSPEKVLERFPYNKGALKPASYSSDFSATIGVNKLRRRVLDATTREEYEKLMAEVSDFVAENSPNLRPSLGTKEVFEDPETYNDDALCRALLDMLHCLMLWKLPMLAERYPQYLPIKYLRNLFLGFTKNVASIYKEECVIDCDFMEGAFLPLPREIVQSWTDDASLFNSLVPMCDAFHWPQTAKREAIVSVGEVGTTYHMLVDGENVYPSTLEHFIWEQLEPVDGCSLDITIMGPVESMYLWAPFMHRSVHKVAYIPVPAIKEGKSRVDFALCQKANELYYRENVRRLCIVSSDSDFSILLETLDGVDWLFLLEQSVTCREWAELLGRTDTPHMFFDKSFLILNKTIYDRHLVSYFGVREPKLDVDSDEEWYTFLEGLHFSRNWRHSDVVREVVKNRRAERAASYYIEEGKVNDNESNGFGSDEE